MSIAVLTLNLELLKDFNDNLIEIDIDIKQFKSIDSIKSGELKILILDIDFFTDIEDIQFLLTKIRKKTQNVPVILVLGAQKQAEIDFNWLVDDYILFPFRKGELAMRINRQLWQMQSNKDVLTIGHLRINFNDYSVHLQNKKLELTYKEFELLRLLVQNRGVVFSRKDLLSKIWGLEYIGGTRTVDVHIRRLRGKLGDEFNSIIETVRNVGYKCKE